MRKAITNRNEKATLNKIIMMSAWSFIIVLSSILFMYVGRWIDTSYNTEPLFMLGMLILAISLAMSRLYMEFKKTDTQMSEMKRRRLLNR